MNLEEFAAKVFNFARSGDMVLMDYIAHGISVNLTNQSGDSLLMLAAYHGHEALTRALIDAGANVNALNDRGQSPLAGTIFKKEKAITKLLLDAGADPDLGTPTARETARMFGMEL